MSTSSSQYHHFPPIQRVAVIGAGSSGLVAGRHLLDAGLDVAVFDRHGAVGEAWARSAGQDMDWLNPPSPSEAAFFPVARGRQGSRTFFEDQGEGESSDRVNMDREDIPASSISLSNFPLPPNTRSFTSRSTVRTYLRAYASHFGLHPFIHLDTRVELVEKVRGLKDREAWRVRLRHLEREGAKSTETSWDEFFDAVIVATGNQAAPFVPPMPGLSLLPTISHQSSYSPPASYSDIAVLIVGSGQSALEAAHRLSPHVRKIWISGRKIEGPESRQAWRRLQRFVLPSNAEVVQLVEAFEGEGTVRLRDGRLLCGIAEVVFATGHQQSYPFLPQYHSDPSPSHPSATTIPIAPLVTDGQVVHHLHHNTFYIPDPTLAIISASPTSTTATTEVQSMAAARVWTRQAALPPRPIMWEKYGALVEKAMPRWLNWVDEGEFISRTTDWLNAHAVIAEVEGVEVIHPISERDKAEELFVGQFALGKGQFQEVWNAGERQEGSAREELQSKVRTAMMRRNGA